MSQFPQSLGTAFATAGFSFDPNLSPNNQTFSAAVLAVINRNPGTGGGGGSGITSLGATDASVADIFAFTNSPLVASGTLTMTLINQAKNAVLVGPTSGANAQPTFRLLVNADLPGGTAAGTGSLIGVSGTATGAGTAAVQISGVPISGTGGTFTLAINTFAGTNPGVVPSSAGGVTNFLRADGAFAIPGGTFVGIAGTMTGPGTQAVVITNASAQGGTFTLLVNTFSGTNPGVVPSSAGGVVNFLRADGAFAVPPGGGTGSVTKVIQGTGIVVTVGTLTATGTVSVDATWSPTWTGQHTFAGSIVLSTATLYSWGGGTGFNPVIQIGGQGGLSPLSNNEGLSLLSGAWYNGTNFLFTGTNTDNAGTSTLSLLQLRSGAINVYSGGVGTYTQAASITQVFQAGGTLSPTAQAYGPTAATLVDMTPDKGTFTSTLGAVTAAVHPVCFWARSGNLVVLAVGTGTGTSNANTFTLAGLPAAITPARIQRVEVPDFAIENSGAVGSITTDVEMIVPTNGTMTFLNAGTAANWGATLFKGVSSVFTVAYLLN